MQFRAKPTIILLDSLTPKSSKHQNSRKIPNFILENIEKNKRHHAKALPKRFHLKEKTVARFQV